MKTWQSTLMAAALAVGVAGCLHNDDNDAAAPAPSVPVVVDVVASFGAGGESFNDPAVIAKYEIQNVGIDTGDGTLRLPTREQRAAVVDSTFPFIWIANSGEGTISKLDVRTGAELGRYRTGPGNGNPSRTTVDQDGNVWVGNRDNNTVTKVGLAEFGQCIDRNGNGTIETSTGKDDVKAWTGNFGDGLGATNAQDECILRHVALVADGVQTPSDIRTVAIDPQNNVFVGGYSSTSLFKINGATGAIIAAINTRQGHYGGVVDKAGNLWSMSSGSGRVQKTSGDMSTTELIAIGHGGYGIAIDKYGKVWTTEYGSRFSAFDPADPVGSLKVFTQNSGKCCAQGIATDDNGDVFIAGSLSSNHVGHYRQTFDANNVFTGTTFVANYTVGLAPTGVAVDSRGAVWSTNYNENSVSRITLAADPSAATVETFPVGLTPYNYSDMTGRVVRTITTLQGTWEAVVDAGTAGHAWKKVIWKLRQALPDGTAVEVSVKVAEQKVDFGAVEYQVVANDAALSQVNGRYLKLRVRLSSGSSSSTPEVTELALPK